jgi:hypothetical protein
MASVHKIIGVPIFNAQIDLYVCDAPNDISAVLHNKYGAKANVVSTTTAHAAMIENKEGYFFTLCFVDGSAKYSNIAHECLHLTYYLLGRIGVECSINNHEVQAYLLEYLIEQVMDSNLTKKTSFK